MKDITHYFQLPNKSVINIPEVPKAEKVLTKKNIVKSTTKTKRKSKQNNSDSNVTLRSTPNTDENEPKDESSSAKKRKGTRDRPPKIKKSKLDDTPTKVENQFVNDETPLPQRNSHDISSDSLFDENSFLENKVHKTYSKKKSGVRLNNSLVNQNDENSDKRSEHKRLIENNVQVCVLLEDCMMTNPQRNINPETNSDLNVSKESVIKLEDSDSDSCFVTEKQTKKKSKLKSNEKLEEDSPVGNNLLNYFNKVDKSQITNGEQTHAQTVITVQAIVHSPPKDKSHLIKVHTRNSTEPRDIMNSKKKKKACNFDDIKVVGTEIIDTDQTVKSKSPVKPLSDAIPSKNSILKVQPWKMRVKLALSSKCDDIITNGKSRKYKRIIESSDSESESQNGTNHEATSDDDVKFVSFTKSTPVVSEKTQPLKLAPLFCKKKEFTKNINTRIRISEEARKLFLESGVPETLKKKMEEQKTVVEEKYNGEYAFPKFNHIQQKDCDSFVWNLKEFSEFKWKSLEEALHCENTSRFSSLLDRKSDEFEYQESKKSKIKFDIEKEISLMKKQEPNVNVLDLRNSIQKLKKLGENSDNLCWTEKYNPLSFDDMIGNTGSLCKLKEWIESHKKIRQIFIDSDDSSGDEFIDSDDSSGDAKNNIAILVGPPGCGKTCAVYMLANELGFKVLEVNAGSNRNGKRIIDELLEATQSHRVKRTSGIPNNGNELKKTKKKKKKKTVVKKEKETMSLILIEDADILFENHDDGFLSALNSLTTLTRRPLIFAVNNLKYPHLQKYDKPRNLILEFDYPSRSSINVWLKLIALTEGVKLTDDVLMELYKIAGSDLRKNVMQLQMLLSSTSCSSKSSKEVLFYQDWLSHVTISKPKKVPAKVNDRTESNDYNKLFSDEEDNAFIPTEKQASEENIKLRTPAERQEDLKALLKTAKFLDYAANLDDFNTKNNSEIFPTEISHQFDRHEDYNTLRLNEDITQFFVDTLFSKFQASTSFTFEKYHKVITRYARIVSTSERVFASYRRISNHVARNCEYLPIIRDIARSEHAKLGNRRSSRFFGHLKSANIEITDKIREILCNTFV